MLPPALWVDLDGLHTAPAPADPPITTHLWAWDEERLLRDRVDGAECILAEMHLTASSLGEHVQVTSRTVPTWPSNEGRVSMADEWRGRTATLYDVCGLMPLAFARLDPPGE